MSTLTPTSSTAIPTTPDPAPVRAEAHPITFTRLVHVELVKMFNTRSGFWLVASTAVLALLASAGVLLFGSEEVITFESFSSAVGIPIAVILPMLAILTVTAEFSQRTGLTTFTLVPHRGRVLAAKALVAVLLGAVTITLATGIGALGNLLGAAVHDVTPVWGFSVADYSLVVLGNVLSMLMGFTLGVLLRNSPAAIVAYFVYSLLLPNVFGTLAYFQEWFMDVWPWVDFFYSTTSLYEGVPTGEQWAQLAVSGLIWMVLPLALGTRLLMRAEVK